MNNNKITCTFCTGTTNVEAGYQGNRQRYKCKNPECGHVGNARTHPLSGDVYF